MDDDLGIRGYAAAVLSDFYEVMEAENSSRKGWGHSTYDDAVRFAARDGLRVDL